MAQSPIQKSLDTLNTGSIEYVYPKGLKNLKNVVLLDAREKAEYETSHLKHAIWSGYDFFDLEKIESLIPEKEQPIVVYCSIGARSEDIGEKLEEAGYTNVKNLYGGIFLWKNLGNPVYNSSNKVTDKVHVFSKEWASLLTNGDKIYNNK